MSRLPQPGADQGVWGDILNDFLLREHTPDGALKIRADNTFEPAIATGQTTEYLRGDKTWQVLDKTSVGLNQVDNTSDIDKPVSTAVQAALDAKVSKAGDTINGVLNMQAVLAMQSQNHIRGYINATDYVDLYADFTNGTEQGWLVPQLKLTGGRFDFNALDGKAEIRVHGSPDVNFYDTDNGRYMFQVKSDRSVALFGNTTVGDDGGSQRWHKVYGRVGGTTPDPESMHYQAVDTRDMAAGVGGGIGFVGKFTSGGATAGFASVRASKQNAVDGDLAGGLVFATRPSGGSVTDRVWIDGNGSLGVGQQMPHARLHVQGSFATAIRTAAASDTLTDADATVLGDASAATLQLTLPDATGMAGRLYTLKKVDASNNAVIVMTVSSQTIDGSASYALSAQWQCVTVQSDGANWLIISNA